MPQVTIAPVVESLDAVPEALRESYEERDGKFVFAKPITVDDASEVKGALGKEREAAREAARRAKELEAKLAAIETERAALDAGLTADKLKDIEAQIEARLRGEYEPKLAKASEVEARARRNALKAALAPVVVDADDAVTLLGDQFEFTDDGVPYPKGKEPGAMPTFLADLRTKKPHLFKGTEAAGGGATGGGGMVPSGTPGARPVRDWSPQEKLEYARVHGREALEKLAAADGRRLAQQQNPARAA